jgi:uncharacterized protein (TIGR03435 family)
MKSAMRVLCSLLLAGAAAAQSSASWAQAGGLTFDVASVKPDKSDAPAHSNFPLNSGDLYESNGGVFSATNFPLVSYIFFAYKLMGNQGLALERQLPGWALTDRFDIEARAGGNPTKDQMRQMMRSLLADRFKFAVHTEKRVSPVVALVLAKPGKTGPQLQPHPANVPCQSGDPASTANSLPETFQQLVAGGFPALCNNILGLPPSAPGRSRLAGRNLTIGFIGDMLGQRVDLGRPVIDGTGLSGTFDFLLEFTPDSRDTAQANMNAPHDPDGPTFEEALSDQLGLKLQSRKSPIEVMVLDHLAHPTEN